MNQHQLSLTVLFVHGTGVRTAEFENTLSAITTGLAAFPRFTVAGCNWGEQHGARLGQLSIPNYSQAKSLDDVPSDDVVELWEQLIADPFLEIRLVSRLATGAGQDNQFSDNKQLSDCNTAAANALHNPAFAPGDPAVTALQLLGLTTLQDAVTALFDPQVSSQEQLENAWTQALHSESTVLDGILAGTYLLARAVLALAMLQRMEQGYPAISATERDALVDWLAGAMAGTNAQAKGLIDGAFALAMAPVKKLGAGALFVGARLGTLALRHYRTGASDAASLRVGDILLYQTRGESIRDEIEAHVRSAGQPVLLLAHSLGGIACVDLLASKKGLPVLGLMTVGSQAPYLHEMGALTSLVRTAPLPPHFPPWLNFYDLNDLLSYLAKPVFGDKVVEDVALQSGQPFPLSHSAYWTNPQLWQRICAFAEDVSQ